MGTISWLRGAGPLVPFAVGFEEERGLGYRPGAIRHHMVLIGQLDRWLTGEGLAVEDLSIALVEGFLASRRASGRRRVPTVVTVARLLEYLRDLQVVPLETLATELLRQGADLIGIAQVLRQSDLGTTSGYAKIDRAVLRTVAQPWPGTRR
ncbi:hypothetical protein [Rhodococcus koreensis]